MPGSRRGNHAGQELPAQGEKHHVGMQTKWRMINVRGVLPTAWGDFSGGELLESLKSARIGSCRPGVGLEQH